MAALEVLAQPPAGTMLSARLQKPKRQQLVTEMRSVLSSYLKTGEDIERILDQMSGTREVGAVPTLRTYLNQHIPDDSTDFGGKVTEQEVRLWVKNRGGYIHSGPDTEAADQNFERLVALVGWSLRCEMDGTLIAP